MAALGSVCTETTPLGAAQSCSTRSTTTLRRATRSMPLVRSHLGPWPPRGPTRNDSLLLTTGSLRLAQQAQRTAYALWPLKCQGRQRSQGLAPCSCVPATGRSYRSKPLQALNVVDSELVADSNSKTVEATPSPLFTVSLRGAKHIRPSWLRVSYEC